MQIFDGLKKLVRYEFCFRLAQTEAMSRVGEQITARTKLYRESELKKFDLFLRVRTPPQGKYG